MQKRNNSNSKDPKIDKQKSVTKRQVEQMIRGEQEIKFLDVVNSTTASYGGTVIALSDMGQGTTNVTRIGNKIMPRKLSFRATLRAADSYNVVRTIIFRWNQRFSTDPPDSSDVLELVNSTNAVNSPLTFNLSAEYKVLYDNVEVLVLSTSTNTAYLKVDLTLKQKEISYFGSSSTDVLDGMYVLFISDSSVTTHPSIDYYSRLRFTDS